MPLRTAFRVAVAGLILSGLLAGCPIASSVGRAKEESAFTTLDALDAFIQGWFTAKTPGFTVVGESPALPSPRFSEIRRIVEFPGWTTCTGVGEPILWRCSPRAPMGWVNRFPW